MKAQWYAEALHRALKGKQESETGHIVARFSEVVSTRGHRGLIARIAEEFCTIAHRAHEDQKVLLVTAQNQGRARGVFAFEHYQKEGTISHGAIPEEVVDETIVGGYQLREKNILIDQSHKRSLVDLYKNITRKH